MFLRNFDNVALLQLGYGTANATNTATGLISAGGQYSCLGTNYQDGNIAVKTANGTSKAHYLGYSPSLSSLLGLEICDICLGNGNTPVTYDDYKLSGDVITNNLVRVSRNIAYDSENKQYITKLMATYTNNTDTTITISEWGMFLNSVSNGNNVAKSYSKYSNSSSYAVLYYREVLDNPVVIEAGTTATLNFELKVGLMHQPA